MTKKSRESPIAMPPLPTVEELRSSASAEELMKHYEREVEAVRAHNDEVFHKDLKTMKLCDYLRGALARRAHFTWCPYHTWEKHWEDMGFPPLNI